MLNKLLVNSFHSVADYKTLYIVFLEKVQPDIFPQQFEEVCRLRRSLA